VDQNGIGTISGTGMLRGGVPYAWIPYESAKNYQLKVDKFIF